jgi:hypothetical protein
MKSGVFLAAVALAGINSAWSDEIPIQIHGQAWTDAGRIMKSTDSTNAGSSAGSATSVNVDGSWMQSSGAEFAIIAALGSNVEGAIGFGTYQVTHTLGTSWVGTNGGRQASLMPISLFKSYITQARMTYYQGEKSAPWFSLTLGNFAYNYAPDEKNLGLYLLRGPVYPGLLFGGFRDFSVDTTKSNVLGVKLHHSAGNFSHDLILMNEQDLPPTLDWSLAYLAKFKAFGALEIGAGANFYRLIPYNSKLETPGHLPGQGGNAGNMEVTSDTARDGAGVPIKNPLDTTQYLMDTTRIVYYTHQGIKLMGMFSLDLKSLLGIGSLGPNDFKLYGEAALLGVKNYGKFYDKMSRRIPVMAGLNIPAFGILDYLSLEVEWYGSRYRDDLGNIGNLNMVADWTIEDRQIPSPVPLSYADSTRDNWKWSLFMEKTVRKHIRFTGQIADDHYRPRPMATGYINSSGGTAEAFTTPKDWYFMFRLGYFF